MKIDHRFKSYKNWKFPHPVPDSMREVWELAEKIRLQQPKLWAKGGNIQGNSSYKKLTTIVNRGYFQESDQKFIKTWQSWMARHYYDFRIKGVVANLKWLSVPQIGWTKMKKMLLEFK